MLKIRLQRVGRKNLDLFRVVVMESSRARDSKTVDIIGSYNPHAEKGNKLKINSEKFLYWKSKGAQLSEGFERIFKSEGLKIHAE
ncbi:MAG: 30S ribosomal protein S16 [bacterium]|nr:30S ribosomal protein S16 [bacterium]